MNPTDLLNCARQRAGLASPLSLGRPRQTDLQRAVSDIYYAMFHALATACANTLAGANYNARRQPEWRRIYRSLEHGYVRRQCNDRTAMAQFPPEIRRFAQHFTVVQREREKADYDPESNLTRREVLRLINETEEIIAAFDRTPADRRRAFAIHVLFRNRPA